MTFDDCPIMVRKQQHKVKINMDSLENTSTGNSYKDVNQIPFFVMSKFYDEREHFTRYCSKKNIHDIILS